MRISVVPKHTDGPFSKLSCSVLTVEVKIPTYQKKKKKKKRGEYSSPVQRLACSKGSRANSIFIEGDAAVIIFWVFENRGTSLLLSRVL